MSVYFDEIREMFEEGSDSVTIPKGRYAISKPIQIRSKQIDIHASGVTILPADDFPDGHPLVELIGSTDNRARRVNILLLNLAGRSRTITGIKVQPSFRVSLVRCNIDSFNGPALDVVDAFDFVAESCDFRNCGRTDLTGESVRLWGRPSPLPGVPANHTGMNTVALRYCTIENYRGVGIRATNQTVLRIDSCKIHGVEKERGISRTGILVDTCNRVHLTANHHVLANNFDVDVRNSKYVTIDNPITSLGRELKLNQTDSDVRVLP